MKRLVSTPHRPGKSVVPLLGNYENNLLRIPFIKTWTDGSMQGGTAHLRDLDALSLE